MNLSSIPQRNYSKAISKVNKIIDSWRYRNLTPFGKITIIKNLLLSKFVHLFIALPITEKILKDINSIFYRFLWGGKPDKVNRQDICRPYLKGGLQMINIFHFEKSMKLKWLKLIMSSSSTSWYNLLDKSLGNIDKIFTFGSEWYFQNKNELNPFWDSVFKYWVDIEKSHQIITNEDMLNNSLWYNSKLGTEDIYFPDWAKKDINMVSDIVNTEGTLLSLSEVKEMYCLNINFLNYLTVSSLVKKFIIVNKKEDSFDVLKPYIPFHVKTIINPKKQIRDEVLMYKEDDSVYNEVKWGIELKIEQDELFWKSIYRSCLWTLQDNVYVWFQYRILRRILGTNDLLCKLKMSQSHLCRLCGEHPESIRHLFSNCSKSVELWENVKVWIQSKIGYTIKLDNKAKILGESHFDEHFWALNFILICTRYYIFSCARKNVHLNIYLLQKIIKSKYQEQDMLSKVNDYDSKFSKRWSVWRLIFVNI